MNKNEEKMNETIENDMNTLYGRVMHYLECYYLHYSTSGVDGVIAELKAEMPKNIKYFNWKTTLRCKDRFKNSWNC